MRRSMFRSGFKNREFEWASLLEINKDGFNSKEEEKIELSNNDRRRLGKGRRESGGNCF